MDTREINLDARAQQRLLVLTHAMAGELSLDEAAAYLPASTRQVRRLVNPMPPERREPTARLAGPASATLWLPATYDASGK